MSWKRQVYKFTFPNGMVYIGCTTDVRNRWAGKGQAYKTMRVGNAIKEFGWENIKKEIIVNFKVGSLESETVCRDVERELIKAYEDRSYNSMNTEQYRSRLKQEIKEGKHRTYEKILIPVFGELLTTDEIAERYGISKLASVRKLLYTFNITIDTAFELPNVPKEYWRKKDVYWNRLGYDVKRTDEEEQNRIYSLGQRPGAFWNYIYETRGTGINRIKQEA